MSRILMVDDLEPFRMLVRTILSFEGHEVYEAQSGPQAVQMVTENQFDLVLMDISMPGEFDGLEACRRIRQRPELKKLPIVMVSASSTEGVPAVAASVGANRYLYKPFRTSDLIETVSKLLTKTQP